MNTDLRRNLQDLFDDPSTMDTICAHVAEGQSLRSLCKIWAVPVGSMLCWIRKDTTRATRFDDCKKDCRENAVEVVLDELRAIAASDIREIFSSDGSMKPVDLWPEAIARCIQSIETEELFEQRGREKVQIGWTKKVRFWDKTKGLELLGKNLGMFIDKTQVDVKVSLEDLVRGSLTKPDKVVDATTTLEPVRPNLDPPPVPSDTLPLVAPLSLPAGNVGDPL